MKTKLVSIPLTFGGSAWVERTAYGTIAAKADFHPDDPIHTLTVGTPKECYKAISSTQRALKNNRLGRVVFGKHAPLDYPERHVLSRSIKLNP